MSEAKFEVNAQSAAADLYLYLTLECRDCAYTAELDPPVDLGELNLRAREHRKVCTDD